MAIYGTGLLAGCLIAGLIIGKLLGMLIGVDANVGGVGIAMLLLIFFSGRLQKMGKLPVPTEKGIVFWSSIYIPIVVAMAAKQNVAAALSGGTVAILAGIIGVVVCFAMVPVINAMGADKTGGPASPQDERSNG